MSDLTAKVKDINIKVQNLILMYSEEKLKNESLEAELRSMKQVLNLQKNRITELEEKQKVLKLAKKLSEVDPAKNDIKSKINEMIREVDKALAMLNN